MQNFGYGESNPELPRPNPPEAIVRGGNVSRYTIPELPCNGI